jgi:hypothetical protein
MEEEEEEEEKEEEEEEEGVVRVEEEEERRRRMRRGVAANRMSGQRNGSATTAKVMQLMDIAFVEKICATTHTQK